MGCIVCLEDKPTFTMLNKVYESEIITMGSEICSECYYSLPKKVFVVNNPNYNPKTNDGYWVDEVV